VELGTQFSGKALYPQETPLDVLSTKQLDLFTILSFISIYVHIFTYMYIHVYQTPTTNINLNIYSVKTTGNYPKRDSGSSKYQVATYHLMIGYHKYVAQTSIRPDVQRLNRSSAVPGHTDLGDLSTPVFKVDRVSKTTKTPRRNAEVDAAMAYVAQCGSIFGGLTHGTNGKIKHHLQQIPRTWKTLIGFLMFLKSRMV